jgi:hypothetical protein
MTNKNKGKSSYEVGYRNPPKHTQFHKGQSGNAQGRPKGSGNFATALQRELKARVPVTEDGKRKKITKREAVAKQLVNKAAAGDPKAIPILLSEVRGYESSAAAVNLPMEITTSEDQAVMQNIIKRIREATLDTGSEDLRHPAAQGDSDQPNDDDGDSQ